MSAGVPERPGRAVPERIRAAGRHVGVGLRCVGESVLMVDYVAAREFIYANASVLEQRLFAVVFDGGEPEAVVNALGAYQNGDGGFGHGLEPDKRAPDSQPLDVEIAFEYLVAAKARAGVVVTSACGWLASIAEPSGAVPIVLPSISGYPRAAHWNGTEYPPEVNPTAAIAAHAHRLGVSHPWLDRATEYCLAELEAGRVRREAHSLLTMAKLVEVAPDRPRAEAAAGLIAAALPEAAYMKLDPESSDYGVTPLQFAPTPEAMARAWFGEDLIESHLACLESAQEPDGGWPISWEPPSEASRWEWRGMRTLSALRTLSGYGRLGRGPRRSAVARRLAFFGRLQRQVEP